MEGQEIIDIKHTEHQIEGSSELPITLDVTANLKSKDQPVVLFCHGFKGFKDWGCWNLVARYFAENGFVFAKFNFSHNGVSTSNLSDITNKESFGNNTFSKELDDLGLVLDWMVKQEWPFANSNDLNIIGHSRGGPIAILKTVEDSRVRKVITWAGVFELQKYAELAPEDVWKKQGFVPIKNGRTGDEYKIQFSFLEDYKNNLKRLDLQSNIAKLDKPYLIIHGLEDDVVPFSHAQSAKDFVEHSIYLELENANHTFGASHPWNQESLPSDLLVACEETAEFILMM